MQVRAEPADWKIWEDAELNKPLPLPLCHPLASESNCESYFEGSITPHDVYHWQGEAVC